MRQTNCNVNCLRCILITCKTRFMENCCLFWYKMEVHCHSQCNSPGIARKPSRREYLFSEKLSLLQEECKRAFSKLVFGCCLEMNPRLSCHLITQFPDSSAVSSLFPALSTPLYWKASDELQRVKMTSHRRATF